MSTAYVNQEQPGRDEAKHGFNFKGRHRSGREITYYIPESDEATAQSKLIAAGITVDRLSVRRILRRASKGRPKRLEFATLAEQMSEQIGAGESLTRVFTMQANSVRNMQLRRALTAAAEQVRQGLTASEALEAQRLMKRGDEPENPTGEPLFPMTFIHAFRVGEESGKLTGKADERGVYQPGTLEEYAKSEKKSEATIGKIKTAITYPSIICVVAVCLILALMYYVIPKFLEGIKGLAPDMDMPLPTKIVMWLSDFLLTPLGIGSVIASAVGAVAAGFWVFKTPAGRDWYARKSIWWPVVGPLYRNYYAALLLRNFATLKDGVSDIHLVLRETALTIEHPVYREMLEDILRVFHDDAKDLSVYFEPYAFLMGEEFHTVLLTWERGGDPVRGFRNYAEILETRVDRTVERALKMIEPAMILGLGGIVIVTVLAAYMPMFELIGTMAKGH